MSKILFLESVAGVAGDMFAASFVDAGFVTTEELNKLPELLGLRDVVIETKSVQRATMRATHLNVKWHGEAWKQTLESDHQHEHSHHKHSHRPHQHKHQPLPARQAEEAGSANEFFNTNVLLGAQVQAHWHTHYRDIDRLLEDSRLESKTKNLARKIFRLIAEAEAEAHGIEVDKVAFHEVGTIDSILDVVMAAYCVTKIGAQKFYATPLKPGRGLVRMQHGTHPVPPPASAGLLHGLSVTNTPDAITRNDVELSTPTGIAIIKILAPQFVHELPTGVIHRQGMGAGTMDLGDYPNVFRVTLLEDASNTSSLPYETDKVVEIICNIDDDAAERVAWLAEQLLQKGALDVWLTPIHGKKGRPAVSLSVLAEESDWMNLADWILRHSSTFGLRHRRWDRLKLVRKFEKRETPQGEVTYKIGMTTSGEFVKEKKEYEDLRRIWED